MVVVVVETRARAPLNRNCAPFACWPPPPPPLVLMLLNLASVRFYALFATILYYVPLELNTNARTTNTRSYAHSQKHHSKQQHNSNSRTDSCIVQLTRELGQLSESGSCLRLLCVLVVARYVDVAGASAADRAAVTKPTGSTTTAAPIETNTKTTAQSVDERTSKRLKQGDKKFLHRNCACACDSKHSS